MRAPSRFLVALMLFGAAACGPTAHGTGGDDDGSDGGTPDAGPVCQDGTTQCDGNSYETCSGGQWQVTDQCPLACNGQVGCVECQPNDNYCVGDDVHSCDAGGNDTGVVQTCSDGLHCSDGECKDLCQEAEDSRSYLGCEYWAVDLDNAMEVWGPSGGNGTSFCNILYQGSKEENLKACYTNKSGGSTAGLCDQPGDTCPTGYTCTQTDVCVSDAQHSPFAIVVANPQTFDVIIHVATEGGEVDMETLAPGEVKPIYPQRDLSVPDRSVDNSGISSSAYQVTSTAPVVAYQFNPLNNVDVFSNDASLLIPRHAFDAKYYGLTWASLDRRDKPSGINPFWVSTNDYNGYISIVSWQDGTQIKVTPTAPVRGGPGFAAIAKGATKTFTLNAFQVLNLEAKASLTAAQGDLTGTLVESVDGMQTFGVFGGHEATVIPSTQSYADHLEEMLFPASTWGSEYAIARSQPRANEKDTVRILAQKDGTTVMFDPAPAGTCASLDTGKFCTVRIGADTAITSNNPILVGHFLEGTGDLGDPSEALAVPTEQFRTSYNFLIPQDYDSQYISLVAHPGGNVLLDGTEVSGQLAAFASGAWMGGRIEVQPGAHTIQCDDGCGIEVYGYSPQVSYQFAGGLDLKQIVVE